jgi:hypothetical protein
VALGARLPQQDRQIMMWIQNFFLLSITAFVDGNDPFLAGNNHLEYLGVNGYHLSHIFWRHRVAVPPQAYLLTSVYLGRDQDTGLWKLRQ